MNNLNPQQLINMMMNNPSVKNNPILNNAMQMYQKGDTQGLQNLAMNVCKERGIDMNEAINNIKSQFGIK